MLVLLTSSVAAFSLGDKEQWPGDAGRSGTRTTVMAYDDANRLLSESVESTGQPLKETLYTYDASGNRDSKVEKSGGVVQKDVDYGYNVANQLTSWEEKDGTGAVLRSATLGYDARGNRNTQTITPTGGTGATTTYAWTSENRLASVTLPDTSVHSYTYDYRVRRINRTESGATTAMTFAGGLSVAEYEVANATSSIPDPATSTVSYQRGPDMGGGVGGLLYSLRGSTPKFNLSNGRGDVVAQSDSLGTLTWTASYEAYGKRPVETGANADRQRANTKEEDPTGLLNEGFRYRDIETGVWLSRDPAGFVDGPNLYAYVRQNPWTAFDPEGLILSYLVEKFDEHVSQPFGDWVADSVSAETCVAVSESKACAAIEDTAQATFKASTMALDVLCPGSATAQATEDVALNGGSISDVGKAVVNDFGGKKLNLALNAGETIAAIADGDAKGALTNATGLLPRKSKVAPGDRAPYKDLKKQRKANGETEPMDLDHRPSLAGTIRAEEIAKGGPLTKAEIGKLKANGEAVATPRKVHQQRSRTYGGRNTEAQVTEDAKDLVKAAAKDDAAYDD